MNNFNELDAFESTIVKHSSDSIELNLMNYILTKLVPISIPLDNGRILLKWNKEGSTLFFENVPYKNKFYYYTNQDKVNVKEGNDIYDFIDNVLLPFFISYPNVSTTSLPQVKADSLRRL